MEDVIKNNLIKVCENIKKACDKVGRNPLDVTLITVSKTQSIDSIKAVVNNGFINFGENKVQELIEKYEILNQDLNWHFIGHLQTNKVKYIVDKVSLIHSVDSIRLAKVIQEESIKKGIISDVLIQVNIAEEETKFGICEKEVYLLIDEISRFSNICIKGLMNIAPFVKYPEENRAYFKKLYELYIDIKSKSVDNVSMEFLSMGMTNDYEIAIEEGSNMVRVGTGIFGERYYR